MARNFHRKDRLSALTEINVTPLIDLAFALLIIFMITTPLLEQTIAL
ncbi:MAG: biopolymer transporter ExbD, partial [Verrucomicrobiota bacterium]|nr:biopolymer transporter ExbD [Verrucomicrobiota bacterium]